MGVTRRNFIKITASGLVLFSKTGPLAIASSTSNEPSPRMRLEDFIKDQNRVKSLKRGFQVMKSRKPSDPRSWFFQGAVHGVTPEAVADAQKQDPDVAKVDQKRFWNQCPHFPELKLASANFLIFEFSSTPNPIGEDLLTSPLHPEGGILRVPDGPGLGIEFDEQKLQQHLL